MQTVRQHTEFSHHSSPPHGKPSRLRPASHGAYHCLGTNPRIRLIGAIFATLLLTFSLVPGARAATLIPVAELPFGNATAATFVDVFGDGHAQLLLTGPRGISLYSPPQGPGRTVWQALAALPPLPAPATAVAAADVTGDGIDEIVVGTAQAGAVYVIRRTGTGWTLLGQTSYMWSPVQSLYSADLSGDGKAEIIAFSADGDVVVYGWEDLALTTMWRLPADVGPVSHVSVADLVGDGKSQLIVAEQGGRISVWQWPLDEPLWQTYVWGLPTSMAVTLGRANGPGELIVTTSERLLYSHRWNGERFVATGAPLNDARLPFTFMSPIRFPGDASTYLLANNAEGLGLWRLVGTSLARIDQGWADEPSWAVQVPGRETFIVAEARHPVSVWERRPTDYFRLSVDGIPRPLNDPPLFRQSQVMLSARDWAAALSMQVYWDAPARRLTAVRGYDYAITTMDEWEVILPEGRRGVTIAPVLQSGRTYMPPEFPAWFDLDYRWDARRRVLDVRTRR